MEGVMMAGKTAFATAVRDPSGEIQIESRYLKRSPAAQKASKIPFLRGFLSLINSVVRGSHTMLRAASVYADDEEDDSRIEEFFATKFKISIGDCVSTIAMFIGILLSVGAFILLPNFLLNLLQTVFPVLRSHELAGLWSGLILGGIKLALFLAYLASILLLRDVRRLYQYHGAEHKTINAFERGVELTPEEVKKCSRIHDRCGTSFLFIVIIINVCVFSVASWGFGIDRIDGGVLRFLARLGAEMLLLPLISGISYEILKLLARFDNGFAAIFKFPGTLLQKALTTREPDDSMLEVAIAAFKKIMEMDADETVPETTFITSGLLSKMLAETKAQFRAAEIDESDAEWIYSLVLDIKRSELNSRERSIKQSESKKIHDIVTERLTGRPLWYVMGDTEFYNCTIKVDERALIPRPETEILAEAVIKSAEREAKILELCTGSGCVAIAIAKARNDLTVTATDISEEAISLAKENAELNNVRVSFAVSDLFAKVHGRFDVIVCNPPYIKSGDIPSLQREVRDFEPKIALDGGKDGLSFYRRIALEARNYLNKEGMLVLECGEGQSNDIINMFPKRDFVMIQKDYSGVDRIIKIVF